MYVKVCGITTHSNMMEVIGLKPDYMGFIFYSPSPRDVSDRIDELDLKKVPSYIDKVAVLVNHDLERARDLVSKYRFQAVQLHGDESPSYCRDLGDCCMVIKAFAVGDRLPESLSDYEGNCDMFLFDKAGERRGGNSEKFNHSLLKDYKQNTPFFLSGGLSPADSSLVLELDNTMDTLVGVDLNSKFEVSPGIKDPALLSLFMKQIRL